MLKKGCDYRFNANGQDHTARVFHNTMTGEKEFFLDGERVHHVPGGLGESASFGGTYPFEANGVKGEFRLKALGRLNSYHLYVNGRQVPGEEFAETNWTLMIIGLVALLCLAYASIVLGGGPNKP